MLINKRFNPKASNDALRFFLDSADKQAWRQWLPSGMFYGVTTNPLLLERAQVPCTISELSNLAHDAFSMGISEFQIQTWGADKDHMIANALNIAAMDQRIVVKVPATLIGTEVAAQLIADQIRVTLTGVYAVHQALTAAAIGADYAAPYLGRINDNGGNGRQDLVAMQQSVKNTGRTVRILTASIRSIEDITYLTGQGLNTFTFSEKIAEQWFDVTATDKAAADFEAAALGE